MQQQGMVVLANSATGRFALCVENGSYVLAEQLDVQPLRIGELLYGQMDAVGIETFIDLSTATEFKVFIDAYGLSFEAVESELS